MAVRSAEFAIPVLDGQQPRALVPLRDPAREPFRLRPVKAMKIWAEFKRDDDYIEQLEVDLWQFKQRKPLEFEASAAFDAHVELAGVADLGTCWQRYREVQAEFVMRFTVDVKEILAHTT